MLVHRTSEEYLPFGSGGVGGGQVAVAERDSRSPRRMGGRVGKWAGHRKTRRWCGAGGGYPVAHVVDRPRWTRCTRAAFFNSAPGQTHLRRRTTHCHFAAGSLSRAFNITRSPSFRVLHTDTCIARGLRHAPLHARGRHATHTYFRKSPRMYNDLIIIIIIIIKLETNVLGTKVEFVIFPGCSASG